jgi:hypothetical protein
LLLDESFQSFFIDIGGVAEASADLLYHAAVSILLDLVFLLVLQIHLLELLLLFEFLEETVVILCETTGADGSV